MEIPAVSVDFFGGSTAVRKLADNCSRLSGGLLNSDILRFGAGTRSDGSLPIHDMRYHHRRDGGGTKTLISTCHDMHVVVQFIRTFVNRSIHRASYYTHHHEPVSTVSSPNSFERQSHALVGGVLHAAPFRPDRCELFVAPAHAAIAALCMLASNTCSHNTHALINDNIRTCTIFYW